MKTLLREPSAVELMEALGECALEELYGRVDRFQLKNFPGQPLAAKLEHLRWEVEELQAAPQDRSEWADVFILILGAARTARLAPCELIALANQKMAINERRQWGQPDAQGVYHHQEVLS